MNYLPDSTLKDLQSKIDGILTPWYYAKYNYYDFAPDVKRCDWGKRDFARLISLLEFEAEVDGRHFEDIVLFDGLNDPEVAMLDSDKWTSFEYAKKIDLHTFDERYRKYDFAMLNQTIEHLYNPVLALENIYHHLRPGGMFYMNFPINNMPHNEPHHFYTGITLMGAASLITMAGFEFVTGGQWGNREYLQKLMENEAWPTFNDITCPRLNEEICPIIGWVWGRKEK